MPAQEVHCGIVHDDTVVAHNPIVTIAVVGIKGHICVHLRSAGSVTRLVSCLPSLLACQVCLQ